MTINIILFSLLGLGLAGLGMIVFRRLPGLSELSEEEMLILGRKKGIVSKLKEVDYKGYWLNLMVSLEKSLLKIKIIFIKLENLLGHCIKGLRTRSQIMSQKSRQWIKQKELKRHQPKKDLSSKTKEKVSIKIQPVQKKASSAKEDELEEEELPLSELKKPIKEEQKWIDLIVENPKNITAYKFLGLLYWRQHNYTDAKASLEMAVKLGSKDKKALEVLEELRKVDVEEEK